MTSRLDRRAFLRDLGIGAAAAPFVLGLPGLAGAATRRAAKKQRLVVMFSPDGVIPPNFWPDETGAGYQLKESTSPLEPFKDKTLFLHGVCNKIRGDGDGHMRGMGCLLTGIELFPGNIQGGSDTPAGWAKGISIDQEIKNFLQKSPATRTRFGSLEFGAVVSDRADTWTRMIYAGANRPIAPIDDPYQMFAKLYGRVKDEESLRSVLDDVREDLAKVRAKVGAEDRKLLEEHEAFVREMEQQLQGPRPDAAAVQPPALEAGVRDDNDNLPKISRMQIELMVSAFKADFARVASIQYTQSVGGIRMRWLGINEGQHDLSHKDDKDKDAWDKLTRINKWYCGELAHLAKRLAETPEQGAEGSMLDHTTIIWTNELGKGNSHTRDNIPFVLVGGGLGFRSGRSLKYPKVPHNRLLISLAHAFGHEIKEFGNPVHSKDGPLTDLT
jgi:hypothetical protein